MSEKLVLTCTGPRRGGWNWAVYSTHDNRVLSMHRTKSEALVKCGRNTWWKVANLTDPEVELTAPQ